MIKTIVSSAVALALLTSSAYATSLLSENASAITRITQGHGSPGETATSTSDPDVTFRVMDNGRIERTNSRYGIVTYIDPKSDAQRNRGRR